MRSALLFAVATAGALGVGFTQPRADATRQARAIDQALLFIPSPDQIRAVSSGFEEPISDLLWVRVVLTFGERWGRDTSAQWTEWLHRMILAVNTLDPTWRTPYYYGGTLLRVSGDIDGSDAVFSAAMQALPDDPFFPFSKGMNAYLYREDSRTAGRMLAMAAEMPGAPTWYAAAAAAMHQQSGERAAGIAYLKDILETTADPGIRADTERQLGRLVHNEMVDSWDDACRAWRAEHGPLPRPEDLARLGFRLPENPRGDAWVVGADGVVRSEGAEQERYRNARRAEMGIIGP